MSGRQGMHVGTARVSGAHMPWLRYQCQGHTHMGTTRVSGAHLPYGSDAGDRMHRFRTACPDRARLCASVAVFDEQCWHRSFPTSGLCTSSRCLTDTHTCACTHTHTHTQTHAHTHTKQRSNTRDYTHARTHTCGRMCTPAPR